MYLVLQKSDSMCILLFVLHLSDLVGISYSVNNRRPLAPEVRLPRKGYAYLGQFHIS